MNKKEIIKKTREYVRKQMTLGSESNFDSAHDWWHIFRVTKTAKIIAEKEKADLFIVELAALLHDIADHKFNNGNEEIGLQKTEDWLKKCSVETEEIKKVQNIIKHISYKGADVKAEKMSLEGQIVQDADILDALGAIGIGRTFAYSGFAKRELYNPEIKPEKHTSFEKYKKNKSSTINHFYEKLLLLKDRMNTETAKVMARQRHEYMERFLKQFYAEWESEQ